MRNTDTPKSGARETAHSLAQQHLEALRLAVELYKALDMPSRGKLTFDEDRWIKTKYALIKTELDNIKVWLEGLR